MRGTGWHMVWLGVALTAMVGCMTTPPDPKPPSRPDQLVKPPTDDPRIADPAAAYPRETMNRLDSIQKGGSAMPGLNGPGRSGGMAGPGMGAPGMGGRGGY
jgi:hypothetical protein